MADVSPGSLFCRSYACAGITEVPHHCCGHSKHRRALVSLRAAARRRLFYRSPGAPASASICFARCPSAACASTTASRCCPKNPSAKNCHLFFPAGSTAEIPADHAEYGSEHDGGLFRRGAYCPVPGIGPVCSGTAFFRSTKTVFFCTMPENPEPIAARAQDLCGAFSLFVA